mmetsp:Transcript_18473/g.57929  ORF Transcript_18473/g.57929 Transcript_18473/m.57929 type:complete len:203 (+) Transcript_18473:140-748(+)
MQGEVGTFSPTGSTANTELANMLGVCQSLPTEDRTNIRPGRPYPEKRGDASVRAARAQQEARGHAGEQQVRRCPGRLALETRGPGTRALAPGRRSGGRGLRRRLGRLRGPGRWRGACRRRLPLLGGFLRLRLQAPQVLVIAKLVPLPLVVVELGAGSAGHRRVTVDPLWCRRCLAPRSTMVVPLLVQLRQDLAIFVVEVCII